MNTQILARSIAIISVAASVLHADFSAAQSLSVSGWSASDDFSTNYAYAATNASSVVPVFVDISIPHLSGGAHADYGYNELHWNANPAVVSWFDPNQNGIAYNWAGTGCSIDATWTDTFTVQGNAPTYSMGIFYRKSGSDVGGAGAAVSVLVNGTPVSLPVDTAPPYGAQRFNITVTNGVSFTVTFELSANGGNFSAAGVGGVGSPNLPLPWPHTAASCQLTRIALPQGASLTSASGASYPTVNDSITPDIAVAAGTPSVELRWINYSPGLTLWTTTDLMNPDSWTNALELPGVSLQVFDELGGIAIDGGGIEYKLTVPMNEPARFFRLSP